MQKSQFIILLTIILLSAISAFAGKTPETFENINNFLERLADEGFSGSILIAKNGKISKNCYGMADREKKIKCSTNTVFSTGSVTKQFTGAAILKLEMQGKLSVKDKISKYFKDLPADKKDITVHQLLTHSAGLPDQIGRDYEMIGRDAFLERAFKTPLLSKPGETYEYSNVGFSIAAAIIEKVSGKNYEEFLYHDLFVPAGMLNTGYSLPKWSDEQLAVGYLGDERWGKMTEKSRKNPEQLWNLIGNGGLLSTVEDLYKWHKALEGNKILSDQAKQKYFAPHIAEQDGGDQYYGYGWVVLENPKLGKIIKHNGGNGIFFADFWRIPREDAVVIVMTNNLKREYALLAEEITRMLFDPAYISTLSAKVDKQYSSLDDHPQGKLIRGFLETVLKQDVSANETFILGNFHPKLIGSVPAKQMAKGLTRLADELKDQQIEMIEDKKDLVVLKYKDSPLRLTLTIKDGKIAGIDVDN